MLKYLHYCSKVPGSVRYVKVVVFLFFFSN